MKTVMPRSLLVFPLLCVAVWAGSAHASLIELNRTNYLQNFNTLPVHGNSPFSLNGWAIREFGEDSGGNAFIHASSGQQDLGGIYSYGPQGSPNRALGTLVDAVGNYGIFGASFQNASPDAISVLNISYTGEEWRLGVASHQRILDALRDGRVADAEQEVRAHIESHRRRPEMTSS